MPARRALLLALVMVLPAAAALVDGTRLGVEISNATADEKEWMRGFDAPAVAFGDFDGDGRREIVAQNENRRVYVFASDRPHVYAEILPPYPPSWGARAITDPVVADVDGDGALEIVVVTSAATVCSYEFDRLASLGQARWTFRERWCRRLSTYDGSGASADGGAWVEDVTGDGRMEVFAQTETRGLFALNWDGTVRWSRGDSGGNAGPVVADLKNDGRKEAIFFSDNGRVTALDASTGAWRWRFDASRHVWPASIPVAGAVADLDGGPHWPEVVFIARDAHDSTNYRNNHFMLFVLRSDGSLRTKVQPSWGNPLSYTHPVLVDVDGDGKRDIVAQDWNTIGHKPGNWERLGPANVFAMRASGSLIWRTSLDNTWSNDDVAVADADADGKLEVLAVGRHGGTDGVWYLDLHTGAKERHVAASGWKVLRGPFAVDLDSDGLLDWGVPVHTSTKGGGLLLYETTAVCRVAYGGWQTRSPCGLLP